MSLATAEDELRDAHDELLDALSRWYDPTADLRTSHCCRQMVLGEGELPAVPTRKRGRLMPEQSLFATACSAAFIPLALAVLLYLTSDHWRAFRDKRRAAR